MFIMMLCWRCFANLVYISLVNAFLSGVIRVCHVDVSCCHCVENCPVDICELGTALDSRGYETPITSII